RACAVTGAVAASATTAFGPDHATMMRSCSGFAERARADSALAANGAVDSSTVRPAGTALPPALPDSQP
ncbi:MAG TPA: hypothetical protein VEB19_19490, partial [Gemmatimonadaceae bacterium]|nr:hypothetical protein [Gemmatimonadaceae bacterium]